MVKAVLKLDVRQAGSGGSLKSIWTLSPAVNGAADTEIGRIKTIAKRISIFFIETRESR